MLLGVPGSGGTVPPDLGQLQALAGGSLTEAVFLSFRPRGGRAENLEGLGLGLTASRGVVMLATLAWTPQVGGQAQQTLETLADGSHMAWLWSRVRDQALSFHWHETRQANRLCQPLPTPAALNAVAMDLLLAGDGYRASYRAAFTFDPCAVLPHLQMPTEVAARDSDVLLPHQLRLPPLPPHVRLRPLPEDRAAVGAQVWQWLAAGARGLEDAPPSRDAALPLATLGDTRVGAAGQRTHLRGGWWHRAGQPRFDCGDTIDLETVQAVAVEFLKEGPGGAASACGSGIRLSSGPPAACA
jgi:hypothetical protein